MSFAIEERAVNKACGPEQTTAERLKYASHRISVLLARCFSGLLIHSLLPDSMFSMALSFTTGTNNKVNIQHRKSQTLASIILG